jgi:hypothetical protein
MRHFRESAMGDTTLGASVDTPKPPIYHARLLFGGNTHSALAQLVEQMTVNHWVAGSSPAGGAKYRKPRTAWFFYFRRSAGREEPSWVANRTVVRRDAHGCARATCRFHRARLDANRTPETYQSRAGGAKYKTTHGVGWAD